MNKTTTENIEAVKKAQEELVKTCKESVRELGIEEATARIMSNQYGLEQVQADFHCLLVTTVNTLINNNIITAEQFDKDYQANLNKQKQEIKELIEKDTQDDQ